MLFPMLNVLCIIIIIIINIVVIVVAVATISVHNTLGLWMSDCCYGHQVLTCMTVIWFWSCDTQVFHTCRVFVVRQSLICVWHHKPSFHGVTSCWVSVEYYSTLSYDRSLFSKVTLHYSELLKKGTVSIVRHFHLQIYWWTFSFLKPLLL